MKRLSKLTVALAITALAGVAGGVTALLTATDDPGPVPTCNGEQATVVLVKWLGGASPTTPLE